MISDIFDLPNNHTLKSYRTSKEVLGPNLYWHIQGSILGASMSSSDRL